jgi:uncharacterized protein (TIGR00299 family) protein
VRTLAFDGRAGAAGDVLLGTLVAAGADPAVLAPVTEALPVDYEFEQVSEQGIAATRAHVLTTRDDESDDRADDDHSHTDHDHTDHDHSHAGDAHADHDHSHAGDGHHSHTDDGHGHTHAEGSGPARTYDDVLAVLDEMELAASVAETARAAFRLLGEAEATVHDTELGATPFHEVGADDAIADVVGVALLLEDLAPDRVVTTPVAAGGGEATFSHGTYPVPTPAVTEIAEAADWRLYGGPVERELLTPTGAAILAAVADGVERLPALRVETSGYGAGGYDLGDRPNVLRATVGSQPAETAGRDFGDDSGGHVARDRSHADHNESDVDNGESHVDDSHGHRGAHGHAGHTGDTRPHSDTRSHGDGLRGDDVAVLETNLDDATPEVLGSLQETLPAAGAYDVTILPTTGKKSRPGHLVTVVCDPGDADRLARRLAEETGTLGVRESGARHRWIAERETTETTVTVGGEPYTVAVKRARTTDGDVYDTSAEYDDALAVAEATGLPVRAVLRRAEAAAREEHEESTGRDERE